MPINYSKRLFILRSFYGSNNALASSLKISASYASRLVSGKRKVSSRNRSLRNKINRRYSYIKNNYAAQWVVEVDLENSLGEIIEGTVGTPLFPIDEADRRLNDFAEEMIDSKYNGDRIVGFISTSLRFRKFQSARVVS